MVYRKLEKIEDLDKDCPDSEMEKPVLYYPSRDENDDNILLPESYDVAAHKYNIEADIPMDQKHELDTMRGFYGRHVVNSNTERKDNIRHLMQEDVCYGYDNFIPTRRGRSTYFKGRVTSEFQMCRSNQEIGGFDRKLQRSVLKREDVDVKQVQDLTEHKQPVKRRFLGLFGKKET